MAVRENPSSWGARLPLRRPGVTGSGPDPKRRAIVVIDELVGFEGRLPAVGDPLDGDDSVGFSGYSMRPVSGAPWRVELTLNYEQAEEALVDGEEDGLGGGQASFDPPLARRVRLVGGTETVHIKRSPKWAGLAQFWRDETGRLDADGTPPELLGVGSFAAGTVQVVVDDFFTASPNVAGLVNSLATRQAPPGFGSPNFWLLMTFSLQYPTAGQRYWVQSTVYQYAKLGWPAQIYD